MLRHWFPTFVAAICLVTTSLSAEENVSKTSNPAGTWHWVQDYGQGPVKNWLILKTDGDKLTGDYRREETKSPIKEGKIEDGMFSFALALKNERNGKPIDVSCQGSVKGDKLQGTSSVVYKEQTTEFELKADRATRPADVVGNWKLHINAEGREFTPEVQVTLADDKLQAKYVSEEAGMHDIEEISLKDNKLVFSLTMSGDTGSLELNYEGVPRGESINGTVQYATANMSGKADFKGKLAQTADAK